MELNFCMQFSSTGQNMKFSFYYKITQIIHLKNTSSLWVHWHRKSRCNENCWRSLWVHWQIIHLHTCLDQSKLQLHDGLTEKALAGNDCVNCCTWSVSWSPARSTCLNPSHPNLICTLTPYTSWMDPDPMTPPTVVAKRKLNSGPPKVIGKSHSLGRVTSNLPSGLRVYDCTPLGRRPRGRLFFF